MEAHVHSANAQSPRLSSWQTAFDPQLPAAPPAARAAAPQRGGMLLRTGRYLLWRFPRVYSRLALGETEPLPSSERDLWIGGFPCSANDSVATVLRQAFGGHRIIRQLPLPPLILRALRSGGPGALLISSPRDAVVSCAMASGLSVRHCLDFYIDFHRVLWPHRSTLLLVASAEVARDATAVVQRLERRFALRPTFFEATADGENTHSTAESEAQQSLKQQVGWQIDRSPALRAKLRTAERLYRGYCDVLAAAADAGE